MTALFPAAVLALATTCGNPLVAPRFLVQEALVESGLDPLAIHDNAAGIALHPSTAEEAAKLAAQLEAQGHDFDAGLMQINRRNWQWLGVNAQTAFDPCTSIGAAAALFVSISKYNTGNGSGGFTNGYVTKVLAAGRAMTIGAPPPVTQPVPSAPVAAPAPTQEAPKPPAFQAAGPWDLYGRARSGDPAFKPFHNSNNRGTP